MENNGERGNGIGWISYSVLVKMHKRSLNTDDSSNKTSDSTAECPGVLPMVDDFEFASNGGVVGSAYGIPGIADGTRINTPPLVSVEQTIPLGYVTTEEDDLGVAFSYELGVCASSSVYSLDGTDRSSALLSARRLVLEGAADSSKRLVNIAKDAQVTGSGLLSDVESNRDLRTWVVLLQCFLQVQVLLGCSVIT
ncbi:hypothetical protein QTG54_004233 [Skeletonema marinoi]|uniref:Uncharacterized protein n=1 Tax=Skeletonema marinoi TaxID=267567 RepID=A0AAD9DF51_9STRA|nr:hypothetical protein QTG54_004233 [Skeletonema marinoi]